MLLYIKYILISILIYGDRSTVFFGPHRLGDGLTADEHLGPHPPDTESIVCMLYLFDFK